MISQHYRKLLTTFFAAAVVFGTLSAVLTSYPQANAAVDGGLIVNPATFGESRTGITYVLTPTIVRVSGGTFKGGGTVYFYVSTTASSSGILAPFSTSPVGSVFLPNGQTTLSNTSVELFKGVSGSVDYAGSYYLLASNSSTASGALVTYAAPITILEDEQPVLHIYVPRTSMQATGLDALSVGSTGEAYGMNFDPGASVSVYLNIPGGTLLTSGMASLTGVVDTFFTVPALSGTVSTAGSALAPSYTVIAEETNALSPSFPQGGVTADSTMDVMPKVSISPMSTSGALDSTLKITGSGFVQGQSIAGFSSTSSGSSAIGIEIYDTGSYANTYYPGITVASNGSFSVSVALAEPITPSSAEFYGQQVSIELTNPAATNVFKGTLYISTPGYNPSLLLSSSSGVPGDSLAVVATGFAASSSITFYFDSSVFTATTDVNGFATVSTNIPSLEGGTYTIIAVGGGYSASAAFTISSPLAPTISDSAGNPLSGEYAAIGSVVTIDVQGLTAYASVTVADSGLATVKTYGLQSNLWTANTTYAFPVTVLNGSIGKTGFEANGLGVFSMSYPLDYYNQTTGTPETITVNSLPSVTYYAVGKVRVTFSAPSYEVGGSVTATVSNLVPSTASYTPETAKFLGPFSFTIDGTAVKLNTGFATFSTNTDSASVTFVLPASIGDGLHTLQLKSAESFAVYSDYEFIVSTPSASSGTIVYSPSDSRLVDGAGTPSSPFTGYPALTTTDDGDYGIAFALYNFPASQAVSVIIYGITGTTLSQFVADFSGFAAPTLSDGLAISTIKLDENGAGSGFIPIAPAVSGSPFLIKFSSANGTGNVTGGTWYYETLPAVSFEPSSFALNGGVPRTNYFSNNSSTIPAGSTVTFYANSLLPNTVYNVYVSNSKSFGSNDFSTFFRTDSGGDQVSGISVTLSDNLDTGMYYIDVASASSSSGTASLFLTVEVTQLGGRYAFPGQVVNIGPITVSPPSGTAFYKVIVALDRSVFRTEDVPVISNKISFSFIMPNGMPGNYWTVGYTYIPVISSTSSVQNIAAGVLTDGTSNPSTFSVTAFQPTLESGSATFSVGSPPTAITNLLLTPGSGTSVSDASIDGWFYSSGTLTVEWSAVLSSTSLTAKISSASVTYSTSVTLTSTTLSPGSFTQTTFGPSIVEGTATFATETGLTPLSVSNLILDAGASTSVSEVTITGFSYAGATGSLNVDYTALISSTSTTATLNGATVTFLFGVAASTSSFYPGSYTVVATTATQETGYATFTVPASASPASITQFVLTPAAGTTINAYSVTGWDMQSATALVVYFSATVTSTSTTATISSASVTYTGNYVLSVSGSGLSPSTYTETSFPTQTESGSVAFSVPAATASPTTITDLILTPGSGTAISNVAVNGWFYSSGTLIVYFTASISSSSLTASISSATVSYTGYDSELSTGITPSAGYTISSLEPETVYGVVSFTSSNSPLTVTSLEFTSPGAGTTVQGVAIDGWAYSSTTLTVEFSATVSSTTTTATLGSASLGITYLSSPTTVTTESYGTAITSSLPYNTTLVSGNGALITGISSGQIATLETEVNTSIRASMQVPLAELNASVVAIDGAVAKISTEFGNMTATLNAINATVSSIEGGQVQVITKLGDIKTSLESLNASIAEFNGNIVYVNTTLGIIGTTLSAINGTVRSNGAGISSLKGSEVTIATVLGIINGKVSSVQNGTSSINTTVGTLQVSANKIETSNSGLLSIRALLIIIVAVIIISQFLAILALRRIINREKK